MEGEVKIFYLRLFGLWIRDNWKRKALEEIEILCHRAMNTVSILNVFTLDQDLIAKLYAADIGDE